MVLIPDFTEAWEFLEAINPDGVITAQVFPEQAGSPVRPMHVHGPMGDILHDLLPINLAGGGIFIMVNKGDGEGRKATNVVSINVIFADDDTPRDKLRTDWPLKPHIVVESSPGKYHYYWLIIPGCLSKEEFTPIQKTIARRFGTDPQVNDPNRVMRGPGFFHHKGEPFRARIAHHDKELAPYTREEVLSAFPSQPGLTEVGRRDIVIPEGTRNNTLYRAGCHFAESGLSAKSVSDGLIEINQQNCTPPLPEHELRQISGSVARRFQLDTHDGQLPEAKKIDLGEVPSPRPFLYGRYYIRDYVTGTAATGGTGKTSLVDIEVICMVLGRDLLNGNQPLKAGPQKVLTLSLEDDQTEFERRHHAIFKFYGLSREDYQLYRENLRVIFDDGGRLKLLCRVNRGLIPSHAAIEHLNQLIADNGITVLIIDPLVSIHEADENSNAEMQGVLAVIRAIARHNGLAVHYLHHNRKGGSSTADDMRGAVALRDGSRALRMLGRANREEQNAMGLSDEDAQYLIGASTGKSNFTAPGADKRWYQLNPVCLDNGTELYDPDYVGVVSAYSPSKALSEITPAQLNEVLAQIAGLLPESMRYDPQSRDWLGRAIAPTLGLDPEGDKSLLKRILKGWETEEVLIRHEAKDMGKGRMVPYYRLKRTEVPDSSMAAPPPHHLVGSHNHAVLRWIYPTSPTSIPGWEPPVGQDLCHLDAAGGAATRPPA